MKSYEASSTIRATPEAIWEILVDGPAYSTWENGVVRVEGRIMPGETIKVVSEVNPDRTFPVEVSGWRPGESMTWSGGMPLGLFRGVRTFTLSPTGDGSTEFTMREVYSGLLLGLIGRTIPDLGPSFAKFAQGLKRHAEQRQPSS
ncbi:MAG: SRPBCC family protein [Candidatus Limnocylindria bacterium]